MDTKKMLLLFLSSMIILIFFANSVSAGCCVINETGCEEKPDEESCITTPQMFVDADCDDLSECVMGCCCDFGTNSGSVEISIACPSPKVFVTTISNDAWIGDDCTCGAEAYTISGQITKQTGGHIEDANVRAGTVEALSGDNGYYTLEYVPAGDVIVRADKISDGCLPNSKTIYLTENTIVDLSLNCQCTPTTCDIDENAYCTSENKWTTFDTLAEYCAMCRASDPVDCGAEDDCFGGDGRCPTECSPNEDDDNYDPDCVCSDEPNDACPRWCSANEDDDNYDADCHGYNAVCGDGFVTYPFETCENSSVLEPGQIRLCGDDDCANPGETGECNCLGLSICGNLIVEGGEDCEIGGVCADGSPCVSCQCGPTQCEGDAIKPSNVIPNFDSDNQHILVKWALVNSCIDNVASFSVWKCEKADGTDCTEKNMYSREYSGIPRNQKNQTDSPVPSNAEFCYYVEAIYLPDTVGDGVVYADSFVEGSPDCETTGDAYCMEPHPDEFCWNNARAYCDDDNNIEVIDNCTDYNPKRFCMGSTIAGGTKCSEIGMCDACNGLYGMFSNIDIFIDEGGASPLYCHPGDAMVEGCYLDRTRSLFSAFEYCSYVESCYDYKSEEACTDYSTDPCGKNQGCEWVWLDEGSGSPYRQLGGVCRPKNEELQKCEFCDMDRYNWLTPGCNPVTCRLFGEKCNYIGGDIPCSTKSTLTCLNYPNPDECTGGIPVVVDARYSDDYNRTGVTNELTVPSQDKHRLEKCYWHIRPDGTGACYKNADNLSINYTTKIGFDCKELMPPQNIINVECESDFTNPETTVLHDGRPFLPTGNPLYPADVRVRYDVTDDRYAGHMIETYFCIEPASQICYPDFEAEDDIFVATVTQTGNYKIYYYSIDYAHNLERRSFTEISVDADPPTIVITDPADGEILTYRDTIDVSGVTSPDTLDTRYICTYNKNSPSKKNCISNCLFSNAPCID